MHDLIFGCTHTELYTNFTHTNIHNHNHHISVCLKHWNKSGLSRCGIMFCQWNTEITTKNESAGWKIKGKKKCCFQGHKRIEFVFCYTWDYYLCVDSAASLESGNSRNHPVTGSVYFWDLFLFSCSALILYEILNRTSSKTDVERKKVFWVWAFLSSHISYRSITSAAFSTDLSSPPPPPPPSPLPVRSEVSKDISQPKSL